MHKRIYILGCIILMFMLSGFVFAGCAKKEEAKKTENSETDVRYWTCGMHPSVRVTDAEYKKGTRNCPICGMNLIETPQSEETALNTESKDTGEVYYRCGVEEEGHCPHCDEGKPDANCICGGHSFMMKMDKPMNCPVCKKPLKKIGPAEEVVSRVKLSPRQIELAGVKTEAVTKRRLSKLIRTVGKVAFDPELAVSQEEFLTAVETRQKVKDSSDPDVIRRADDLIEKSKFKLKLLGMSDDEIAELEKEGKAQLNLVLPEERAWVYADIYEYELGWIKSGQNVSIATTAYPDEKFEGVIKSISPVLSPMTRSAKIRIETDNKGKKLQPEMYADVVIESMYVNPNGSHDILAVPKSAILDTGERKIIYIDMGEGTYIGKEVKLGPEGSADVDGQKQKFYPVISGLKEGDKVVTRSNFLIDSQSQLSGGISGVYGGALTAGEEEKAPQHPQH